MPCVLGHRSRATRLRFTRLPGKQAGKIFCQKVIYMRIRFYFRPRPLARAAVIAALYVVLCLVLAPLSFGVVQLRFSEALTLLPVICPEAVIGVTLGCFLANMLASSPIDMLVGTLATLLAALLSYKWRGIRWKGLPLASAAPPVIINALAIGIMLTLLFTPGAAWPVYLANIGSVGAGQLLSCGVLGIGLVRIIEKNPSLLRFFAGNTQGPV